MRDGPGLLTRSAREYGDLVTLRMGPVWLLFVAGAALVEEVLVTRHEDFAKGRSVDPFRVLVGNGLFTSDGAFWRRQRRLAQPAFHRQRVAGYGAHMAAYTQRLLDEWRVGETRDVHEDMMRLTLQIVGKTLFDTEVDHAAVGLGRAFAAALQGVNERAHSLVPLPLAIPTRANVKLRTALRTLDATVYGLIAARRADGADHGDLLSMLLHARDEDGSGMTDRQLRDEAMTIVLAGHETTATALSWAWHLLAQHPQAEARLHAEVDAVLPDGRLPTLDDLPKLRFAEMVFYEALRLYPPAWIFVREAVRDTSLGGQPVRRGTRILLSPYVVHRDPRNFEDPDTFRPERWEGDLQRRLPKGAYFPFSLGQRMCVGNAFALMEAVLIMSSIARRFRLTPAPDASAAVWARATLRPRDGIRMVVHPR